MNFDNYSIVLRNAVQQYPNKDGGIKTVLNNIDLSIRDGEFVTVVGPTGCGKSTLLRLILGSEIPVSGQATVKGVPIVEPSRDRGIVLQRYSLFPNRTVRENVMFGLELEEFGLLEPIIHPFRTRKKDLEFADRANSYLERVDLLRHADKYPHELSGGMRQRAAIAQAMIMQPEILLMDEPFGALDIGTREAMQIFLLEQWQRDKQTVLFVTHDLEEAIFLGTRLIVVSQFYTDEENNDGRDIGAKIVKDVSIPWEHPRPTHVKHTQEFNELMEQIRREGLDPEWQQDISEFDLSHQDAAFWKDEPDWQEE